MNLVDHADRELSLNAISRAFQRSKLRLSNEYVVTSTYSYDPNGNLTTGAGWGYTWDYLNRMHSSGFGGSTTTYAYDAIGNRVLQTSTTSTTFYPSKFYSFSSMLSGGTTYATSTNYIWNGDTLLATIDHKLVNGTATGTATTRYIHPDHLGSTNAVTDQNGALVQLLDYYPYGATRVSTSTYPTSEKRDYIGQFTDPQTSLDYLNARYYSPTQGQFLSEDPVFLGEPKLQDLVNPQNLNSYSYAVDNPITRSDPSGKLVQLESRPVFNVNGYYIGEHTFFMVTPDNPSSINIAGVPAGTKAFTFGGYPSGNPLWTHLTKGIGFSSSDPSSMDTQFAFGNGAIINKTTITPPNGESDTQFINSMGSQFNSINPNPGGKALFGAPGYGTSLPATSIYKQIIATLTNIKNTLSNLINNKK